MPYVHQDPWVNGGEADGLDGFASGIVCGIRSHRDHTLLLAATTRSPDALSDW
jgi:hypothetical protein